MPEPPIPEVEPGAGELADSHSAPLSGALLARKGAASADGFTLAETALTRTRMQSSYRWRLSLISATLAISIGAITFVGATLMFGGGWAPFTAPERTAEAPAAQSTSTTHPAAIESLAIESVTVESVTIESASIEPAVNAASPLLAAASSPVPPKPLAVAVADDLRKQHADKIVTGPTTLEAAVPKPVTEPVASDAVEQVAMLSESTGAVAAVQPKVSPPPRPKKRPRAIARSAYRVQLHALASDAAVRREWRRLRKRHRALFSGLKLTVSPKRGNAGNKTVFRMQLGALSSRTQARTLCKKLHRRKMSCMVVR